MEKSETFFAWGGGRGGEEHGSSPLAPEARGRHSTSTSLALKVIRIVYNPPFEKFLDPPLIWKVVYTTDTESALSCKNDRKIGACYFVVMPLISKQKNHEPAVTVSHADPHSTACTSIYKRDFLYCLLEIFSMIYAFHLSY